MSKSASPSEPTDKEIAENLLKTVPKTYSWVEFGVVTNEYGEREDIQKEDFFKKHGVLKKIIIYCKCKKDPENDLRTECHEEKRRFPDVENVIYTYISDKRTLWQRVPDDT